MKTYDKKRNLTNSTRREEEWDAWKRLHKSKHKVNEKIMTTIQKALKTWKLHECNEEISQRKWNLTKLNKEGRRMGLEQKNKEKRKKKHKKKGLHKAANSSQQTNKHKERSWWRGVEKLYLKLWNSCALPVVNLELSGFVLGLLPLHPKKANNKTHVFGLRSCVCAILVFSCTLVVSLLGCLQRFCGYGGRRARESVSWGAIWRRIPTQTATTSFRSRGFLLCRRRRRMATRLSSSSRFSFIPYFFFFFLSLLNHHNRIASLILKLDHCQNCFLEVFE